MIGRATRRCDEIGKTVFKIYDPVDNDAALEDVTTMKPLVKDPNSLPRRTTTARLAKADNAKPT
jgi:type I site-specific restriction endonuclease